MSSLEKKAFWVKVPIIGGNPNIQVVTLVEAQKEITELREQRLELTKIGEELEAKIEAANKILAELDVSNFATGETRKDGTEYHNFNIDQWYARLKASLSQEDTIEEKTT
jgi:hypothetical protein